MKTMQLTKPAISIIWFVAERAAPQQNEKVTLEDLEAVHNIAQLCRGLLGDVLPQVDREPNWKMAEYHEDGEPTYEVAMEDGWFTAFEKRFKEFNLGVFRGLGNVDEAAVIRSAVIELGRALKNPGDGKKLTAVE